MLYQREPVLPVDIEYNENNDISEELDSDWDIDEDMFSNMVQKMLQLRGKYFINYNIN